MNKDVVYIEPEDDITDIINRLKSATEKVVALVPSKKLGVLRSAINLKLIHKTAKESEKVVVIVTTDSALTKLALAAGLPVAKTLSSRPTMPGDAADPAEESPEEDTIIEEETTAEPAEDTVELNSVEVEEDLAEEASPRHPRSEKPTKSAKSKPAPDSPKDTAPIPTIERYRKWIILGAAALITLIVAGIWAFAIAPAATINVVIRASASNFSENISFTKNAATASAEDGIFFLEERKYTDESSVSFTPTGEKNIGEKASGQLIVYTYFKDVSSLSVPAGTSFYFSGLEYIADSSITLSWDGSNDACEDGSSILYGCVRSATISVTAAGAGSDYNITTAQSANWSAGLSGLLAYNNSAITGGTDKISKVVTKEDIEKAESELEGGSSDGRDHLLKDLDDDLIAIESSLKTTISDPTSSPAVGEAVEDGKQAKLTSKTTYTVFVVKKSDLIAYIESTTNKKLTVDQHLYDAGSPFIERFLDNGGKYTAKLKSTIYTGPNVTEEAILEKSKGKKVGEVQSLIKSINGVTSVKVDTSFPWVRSVPADENKITINLTTEE